MMSFWNITLDFFWHDGSFAVLVMALGLALLLLHFRKNERKSVFNTLVFFFVCLIGQFVSGVIHALEFTRAAEVLHEVFVIGAGIALIRLWVQLLFRIVLPLIKLSPPRIAEDIIVIIAYLAWGMVRLRYAGLDLGSIVATSALITVVVAFAMQDTLGNILGGVALQLDNSIKIGDWIKVDDVSGRVVDIRWRSTLVETNNWETVVFPNSQLMKSKFLVLGRRSNRPVQWRRWVWFNVGLDIAPSRVTSVIEESILQADINNVARHPPPSCVLMEMDKDGNARYALRYWLTNLEADDPTDAAMRWHIFATLQRAGIKLAVSNQNIHITEDSEKHDEIVHQREIQLRMKTLRGVELFSQMTDAELRKLAERLRYAPFAKGNIISRQGSVAHWLYVIINGDAEVYLETSSGEKHLLRTMSKGNFFGEMGMMTGAPRAASVVARTDVECYRLDKKMFEEILRARPAIAEEMSSILATRRAELDSVLQYIDTEGLRTESPQRSNDILATMRRFFGLGG